MEENRSGLKRRFTEWGGALLFSGVCAVGFVIGTNIIIGPKHISLNDLHLAWLISPGRFFVPSASAPGAVETNPELVRLDNPSERFLKNKPAGTFRIFCVGGSTTRGWPFHKKLSYPALLSLYLRDLLPGRKVEVVNAGFMAFDSTSDRQLVTEILEYGPDLILLYTGRNEEWTFPFHNNERKLKFQVWLMRNIRLYGFLRERKELRSGSEFDHAKAVRDWTKDRAATYGGTGPAGLNERLEENLQIMAEAAGKKNCRLGILTQIASSKESSGTSVISSINSCLERTALRLGSPVLDLAGVFKNSGRRRDDLFIDAVPHPDASGYILMARSAAKRVASMDIVAPENEWKWPNLASDETYFSELGVPPAFVADTYNRLADMLAKLGETADSERYRAKALRSVK